MYERSCNNCGETYKESGRTVHGLCPRCRAERRLQKRRRARNVRHQEAKERLFALIGDVCACCGEKDKRFLTTHHVNNDPAVNRRATKRAYQGPALLIKEWFAGVELQTLCFNCNCGIEINGGVCPHQDPL